MSAPDGDAGPDPAEAGGELAKHGIEARGRYQPVCTNELIRIHLPPPAAPCAFHDDRIIGLAGIREGDDPPIESTPLRLRAASAARENLFSRILTLNLELACWASSRYGTGASAALAS
jgi:hypothetical protein